MALTLFGTCGLPFWEPTPARGIATLTAPVSPTLKGLLCSQDDRSGAFQPDLPMYPQDQNFILYSHSLLLEPPFLPLTDLRKYILQSDPHLPPRLRTLYSSSASPPTGLKFIVVAPSFTFFRHPQ